jgi:hypothetical protein
MVEIGVHAGEGFAGEGEVFGLLGVDGDAGPVVDAVAEGAGVLEFERERK